jgi:hypothetical protein
VETEEVRPAPEDEALLGDDRAVFTARVEATTSACPGRPARLAVDPAGFYFFDAESGEALQPAATPAAVAVGTS